MLKKFLIGTIAVALMLTIVSSVSAFSGATLRKGSTGADVMELQTLVGATPVDGIFGSGTEAKVKAWQANNMLTADGVFGPASMAKAAQVGSPVVQLEHIQQDVHQLWDSV
jgi:N-acetylmuramoyl-L-alanine amidase